MLPDYLLDGPAVDISIEFKPLARVLSVLRKNEDVYANLLATEQHRVPRTGAREE